MRRWFWRVCAVFLFCVSTSVIAAETAKHALKTLLSHYQTYSAQFDQRTQMQGMHQTSSGTFSIQKPNRFRWEVRTPSPQSIIADGQYLWVYDPDLEQATRQRLDQLPASNPARLLSQSSASWLDQFAVQRVVLHGSPWFVLKAAHSGLILSLHFSHQLLDQIEVKQTAAQTSLFHFSHMTLNQSIPSSQFVFHPPKGVDVLVQ